MYTISLTALTLLYIANRQEGPYKLQDKGRKTADGQAGDGGGCAEMYDHNCDYNRNLQLQLWWCL